MDTVFNMGIGIALIVPPSDEQLLRKSADEHNILLYPVGRLTDG